MGELNKMTSEQRDDIRVSFDKAMKCCYEIFKNDAFRKKYSVTDKRKPISKSVYGYIECKHSLVERRRTAYAVEKCRSI